MFFLALSSVAEKCFLFSSGRNITIILKLSHQDVTVKEAVQTDRVRPYILGNRKLQ